MSGSDRIQVLSAGESAALADDIRRAHAGDAWHGPALAMLLRDVSPAEALAQPISGLHSIWELVLHLTSWTREVTRRLRSGQAGEPADGDWPAIDDATADAWLIARRELAEAHEELESVVRAFPDDRLSAGAADTREPARDEVSFRVLLSGLVQHDAYHGGQIAMLRRALRGEA